MLKKNSFRKSFFPTFFHFSCQVGGYLISTTHGIFCLSSWYFNWACTFIHSILNGNRKPKTEKTKKWKNEKRKIGKSKQLLSLNRNLQKFAETVSGGSLHLTQFVLLSYSVDLFFSFDILLVDWWKIVSLASVWQKITACDHWIRWFVPVDHVGQRDYLCQCQWRTKIITIWSV